MGSGLGVGLGGERLSSRTEQHAREHRARSTPTATTTQQGSGPQHAHRKYNTAGRSQRITPRDNADDCADACAFSSYFYNMVLLGLHNSSEAFATPRTLAICVGLHLLTELQFCRRKSCIGCRAAWPIRVCILQGSEVRLSWLQAKCRGGRLLHQFHPHHGPPRSARPTTNTCRFSEVSGLLCPRRS